jgi:CRP-like cAMP-binding protein
MYSQDERGLMDTTGIGGRILYYEDGEVIFEENSTGDEIYIVESGKVEISQRINGRKTSIAVFGRSDVFGEMAVFADAPRAFTATAIGRTTLVSFSMTEILHLMQTDLRFAMNLLEALIRRLHNTTSTLANLIARVYDFGDSFMEGLLPEKKALKIGEILLEMGFLTSSQLERCLQKQKEVHILKREHRLMGEIMVESGIITEEQLRNALAEQRLRLRNSSED